MKQAVILAACAGVRIQSASNGTPKCLLRVGDRTLLEHQLNLLAHVGITRVCVITGHGAAAVHELAAGRCEFITNTRYDQTNSLVSLWMARQWVNGSFVLMNGDVLAHHDIFNRVLAFNGNALAYDSSSGRETEHMKVIVRDGLLVSISKQIDPEQSHGENLGILQFDAVGARKLFEHVEALILEGHERTWAPMAVDRLAKLTPIRAIDVCGLPWTEIDFPEDLVNAQRHVWPRIANGAQHDYSDGMRLGALKRVS